MDERFIPAANAVELSEDDEIESSKFATAVKKIGGGVLITASVFSLASCGPDAEGTAPAKPEASVSATDSQDVDPKDAEFTPSESPSPTRSEASDLSTSSANETGIAKPSKTAETTTDTTTAKPSATVKPEPTPSATEKEVDSYRFEVTKEEFDALMALSDKEFSALDIKDRMKIPQYLAASVEYNTELYVEYSKSRNDRLPKEISINNTSQEILATIAAINREAYFRKDPNGVNDLVFSNSLVLRNVAGLGVAPDSKIMNATKERLADYDRLLQSGQTEVTLSMPDTAGLSRFINASTAISETPVFDGLDGRKTKVMEIEDGPENTRMLYAVAFIKSSEDSKGLWVEVPVPATAYPPLVPVS